MSKCVTALQKRFGTWYCSTYSCLVACKWAYQVTAVWDLCVLMYDGPLLQINYILHMLCVFIIEICYPSLWDLSSYLESLYQCIYKHNLHTAMLYLF